MLFICFYSFIINYIYVNSGVWFIMSISFKGFFKVIFFIEYFFLLLYVIIVVLFLYKICLFNFKFDLLMLLNDGYFLIVVKGFIWVECRI